jgi:hypothetical protein
MGDLEVLGWFVLGAIALFVAGALIADREKKPKSNVRLPRRTAWDRAAHYYEDRS